MEDPAVVAWAPHRTRRRAIDLPKTFTAADELSMRAQGAFLRSTRVQLGLLVLAGMAGPIAWTTENLDISALVAGLAFSAAAALRIVMIRTRPHRDWYEGRAVAESVKTLSWRFATGGRPFPLTLAEPDAAFASQVRELFEEVEGKVRAVGTEDAAPTGSMKALRASGLTARREAYADQRLEDALGWYSRKADWNLARAHVWSRAILVLQVAAAAGAFLTAFGVVHVDLFGLAGALVASIAAWVETKQHSTIASAYRVAVEELRRILELNRAPRSEDEWADFVASAEEAISREHTMWKASSSRLEPVTLA